MPVTPTNIAIASIEAVLLLAGIWLLWRHVLGAKGRETFRQPATVSPWTVTFSDFLTFAFLMIAGGLFAAFVGGFFIGRLQLPQDTKTILNSATFQLGLLIGPALLPLNLGHHPLRPKLSFADFRSGAVTFLITLPIVTLANLAWLGVLEICGLPVGQQDLLRLFSEATQPAVVVLMILLATIVAPMAEELLFRATLFRYLRTRIPRWMALLLPGTLFAVLHVNWVTLDGLASLVPLITLAVIFSVAYERTGKIATAMVAHGLFNLHTILLLVSGVTS